MHECSPPSVLELSSRAIFACAEAQAQPVPGDVAHEAKKSLALKLIHFKPNPSEFVMASNRFRFSTSTLVYKGSRRREKQV